MPLPTPTETPAAALTRIVRTHLIPVIVRWLYRRISIRAPVAPALSTADSYVWRLARRFTKLEQKYRAGTLRTRPHAPRTPTLSATPRNPSRFAPVPRRWGWLSREIPDAAATASAPLLHLLRRPDTVAMIAAHPLQTGRILRPLCRALLPKASLPPALAAPPRPKAPEPVVTPTPEPSPPAAAVHPVPPPPPTWFFEPGAIERALWGHRVAPPAPSKNLA